MVNTHHLTFLNKDFLMKFAIIAAAILSSSAAFAADNGVMNFRAESLPTITLNVTNGDAVLNTGEAYNADHIATATILSNMDTRINITGTGAWTDLSAYKGVTPNHLIQTTFRGANGDTQYDHQDVSVFEEKHGLKAGVETEYLMSVRSTAMTNVGTAAYSTIIQVSAE